MPRLDRAMHTVRSATSLTRARPAYAAGLRAATATVLPLLADALFGLGGATWMSLGGFNGALADKGGPYRTRAATMAAVTLASAIAVLLGTLASGHPAVDIPLVFAVALACGLARVWGAAGVSVAGAALSTFAIALAVPAGGPADALVRAGFAVVGGLVAMAIALVLWPLRPFRPARMAVADSYRALAGYADDLALYLRHERAGGTMELPAGSAAVRAALETARGVLARMRRGRPGSSGREESLIVLGEAVDQIFGHLVAAGETVDTIAAAERAPTPDAELSRSVVDVAATARLLAIAVETERAAPMIAVAWSGDALRQSLAGSATTEQARAHYEQAAAIIDRAAQYAGVAAVTAAALDRAQSPPEAARAAASPSATQIVEERTSPLAMLRAVLAPGSLIFRYALRLAVVTTIAVGLAEAMHLKRGYWLTITVIVILQPYTGATTLRALQRVLGTVLGAILTALLGAAFHDPRAILVLSFLFAASCVALLPVNYAAYSVFLTPTFVLLAEASAGDWHLASTRVMNTLIGGGLALVGARLLWPSPEWQRLPGYMAAALRANREYLQCVVELFADRSQRAGARIRSTRRGIGLASVNAEESFQRLLGEFDGPPAALSPVMTSLTYTRRLTASIAALALARHAPADGADVILEPFARRASGVLEDLAGALEEHRPPAPLPILVEVGDGRRDGTPSPLLGARVDRLARQIRLLHDAVDRWVAHDQPAGGITGSRYAVRREAD
ncbi:MAG: FUSC family protein [Gemmatimonadales bacterium]